MIGIVMASAALFGGLLLLGALGLLVEMLDKSEVQKKKCAKR